jgi:hypothetical protein
MLVHRLQSKRTLPQRILAVFATQHGLRLHYTFLAQRLHHPPPKVLQACWRLARQGRLVWYSDGVYGLPQGRKERPRG